ncbi:MAG: O-antigen ligase family protein [Patescibacteria group bacterium]|jgi:putative inorganic carbon (HCO3(-)) transporter
MEGETGLKLPPKRTVLALLSGLGAAVVLSIANAFLPGFVFIGLLLLAVVAFFVTKEPWLGVLLVVFFLPFERLGAYELGGTTIRISQIILIITLGAWFFSLIIRKKFNFAKNPALVFWILFIAINIVGLANSLNLERSVMVLIYIIFTSLLAFLVPNLISDKERVKKVVSILLISFVIVSIFGLWQFLGDMAGLPTTMTGLRELYTKSVLGFSRVQSTAYEPLYFANYLLLPISLLFALFLSGRNAIKSGWLIILIGLGMVNLILTVSRGGYLAIAFSLLVIGIYFLRRLLTVRNLVVFGLAAVLVGYITVRALGSGGQPLTLEKFQGHVINAFYGASYEERVETFTNAFTIWREYPAVGIGPGSFGPYVAPHPYYMPKDGWKIVNNEFIEILAENGLIGLAVFSLFCLFLIIRSAKAISRSGDRYLRAVMIGLLGAFIGVLAQYQTFSTLYIMQIWFMIGLMIAVQNIIFAKQKNNHEVLDKAQ